MVCLRGAVLHVMGGLGGAPAQFATRTGALGTFPSMGGVGRLSGIALECRDPARLADFYSKLTGWPVVYSDPDWYSVGESERAEFHLSSSDRLGTGRRRGRTPRHPCSFTCTSG